MKSFRTSGAVLCVAAGAAGLFGLSFALTTGIMSRDASGWVRVGCLAVVAPISFLATAFGFYLGIGLRDEARWMRLVSKDAGGPAGDGGEG